VVASVFWDQPFWGRRLAELGAGVTLPFRTLTPRLLGDTLDRVLTGGFRHRAAELGHVVRSEDGTRAAAGAVERRAVRP
jgi:sterol 3beta-glucosyltransferase